MIFGSSKSGKETSSICCEFKPENTPQVFIPSNLPAEMSAAVSPINQSILERGMFEFETTSSFVF